MRADEVDSRGARPKRSSGLTLLMLVGGAVVAAVLLGQLTAPMGAESVRRCPVPMGALTLGDQLPERGSALQVWDCDALRQGPWSLVIRAKGGHFGVRSAVVTYPAENTQYGVLSTKDGGVWNPGFQTLVFPLGTSQAQIVGDLGLATLESLAARITVVNGRPHFEALDGFAAATTGYRSPVVHEMRYGAVDLGQKATLGNGLVFTGVTWAASFESLAFESHAKPAGFVHHRPAVYSGALGGSGTLAWESAPGEATYIGFSGNVSSAEAIEALRALANKGRVLTPAQWRTEERAQVIPQADTPP